MGQLRHWIARHRSLAALAVCAALALRVLVPAGYMIGSAPGQTITVQLCDGMTKATVEIALPGKTDNDGSSGHQAKEMPCAFAGLSAPGLTGADPALLADAVAAIVAGGVFTPAPLNLAGASAYLRPPLRGPPIGA